MISELMEKMFNYLMDRGFTQEKLQDGTTSPFALSMMIAKYAHRNQKRENGEDYFNHPFRCLRKYLEVIGANEQNDYYRDDDLLNRLRIPTNGIEEVCLLHDVVEDTELKIEDIESLFKECDLDEYFEAYIKEPLERITHDKDVQYKDYIKICLGNPISALAKMLDLQDNLDIFGLTSFTKKNALRAKNYVNYIYEINMVYHFLEHLERYRKTIQEEEMKMASQRSHLFILDWIID